jgi:hypothetical protein
MNKKAVVRDRDIARDGHLNRLRRTAARRYE